MHGALLYLSTAGKKWVFIFWPIFWYWSSERLFPSMPCHQGILRTRDHIYPELHQLSMYHPVAIFTTTPWRDTTIHISQRSWWVLADSAWSPLILLFTWILWTLFLSLPPAPAASISSWVSTPGWAPSWLSQRWLVPHRLSKPLCDPQEHAAFLIQPNSNSPVSPPLPTHRGWSALDGPNNHRSQKFLHSLCQGLQEQDQKKLRHAPGPIKTPQGRCLFVKPHVTALSASGHSAHIGWRASF